MPKCPGQDSRFWKSDHVYEVACAHCGQSIEFFKDDLRRKCPHCGKYTVNPKNDLGCAAWCKFGPECLAQVGMSRSEEGTEQKPQKG
jgi:rRNA maturation protein Nop10